MSACAYGGRPHGTVGVVLVAPGDLLDGPLAGHTVTEYGYNLPRILHPGSSGVLLMVGDRLFHYHPEPCSDGVHADKLRFTHECT